MLGRRPIKHVLNDVQASKAGNAQYTIKLVKGVTNADPYGAAQSEVNAGSAVITHIEIDATFWIDSSVTVATNVYSDVNWGIFYNIAGAQTKPVMYSVGTSDLKNQVFAQGDTKLAASTTAVNANPTGASESIRFVHISLNIPKLYQNINKDDEIQFITDFTGQNAAIHNVKIQAYFKEYQQA